MANMVGTLRVSPDQLIATASEFSSIGSVLANLTTEMTNKVTGLASGWEGEAATAYITKFRGLDDDIQKMMRMVAEHSTDLQDMAKVYQNAEAQNAEDFTALSDNVIV